MSASAETAAAVIILEKLPVPNIGVSSLPVSSIARSYATILVSIIVVVVIVVVVIPKLTTIDVGSNVAITSWIFSTVLFH